MDWSSEISDKEVQKICNSTLSSAGEEDSLHDYMHRSVGETLDKTVTLNVNNGSQSLSCFRLTGTVEILKLHAELVDATSLANCTDLHFDLCDGTDSPDITASPGAVLSGLAVGTQVVKDDTAASAATVIDNAACAVSENASLRPFAPFLITQKSTVGTYVRLTYTSTDAPANAKVKVFVEYRPLGTGTLVAI